VVPPKVRGSDSQSPGRQGVSSSWHALDAFRLFMKSGDGGGSNRVLGYGRRTTAYNSSITSKQSPSIIALRPGNPREVSLTDSIAYFALSPSGCCERLWHPEATEPAKLSIALSTATAKQTGGGGLPLYQQADSHNGLCRKPPHCSSLHAQSGPSGSFNRHINWPALGRMGIHRNTALQQFPVSTAI
jgi:hypothetical protein